MAHYAVCLLSCTGWAHPQSSNCLRGLHHNSQPPCPPILYTAARGCLWKGQPGGFVPSVKLWGASGTKQGLTLTHRGRVSACGSLCSGWAFSPAPRSAAGLPPHPAGFPSTPSRLASSLLWFRSLCRCHVLQTFSAVPLQQAAVLPWGSRPPCLAAAWPWVLPGCQKPAWP